MPSYDISNVDILCTLTFLFPGERASFYRRVLYYYRSGGVHMHHGLRGHYTEYFRYNYDGYQSNSVNRYGGQLWNRDPADMGWYPTSDAIARARDAIKEMNNQDDLRYLTDCVAHIRDFLATT